MFKHRAALCAELWSISPQARDDPVHIGDLRAAEPPDLRMVLKQEFILVKDWNALPASLRDLIFAHMDERDRSMAARTHATGTG